MVTKGQTQFWLTGPFTQLLGLFFLQEIKPVKSKKRNHVRNFFMKEILQQSFHSEEKICGGG